MLLLTSKLNDFFILRFSLFYFSSNISCDSFYLVFEGLVKKIVKQACLVKLFITFTKLFVCKLNIVFRTFLV